jgi:hypothetical protein
MDYVNDSLCLPGKVMKSYAFTFCSYRRHSQINIGTPLVASR